MESQRHSDESAEVFTQVDTLSFQLVRVLGGKFLQNLSQIADLAHQIECTLGDVVENTARGACIFDNFIEFFLRGQVAQRGA